ncbi:MAG TPA: Maf family protein [Fimbriimonadaceae bacterium]|nr:Maf family protein [Fimbriimonadaceae bacterium]
MARGHREAREVALQFEIRQIILASASPRRLELLKQLAPEFEVVPSDVPETELGDPWETAVGLALAKARAVAYRFFDEIVIGADTVVAYEEDGWHQLAKPENEADARRMLRTLSNREHVVITGIAVIAPEIQEATSDTTRVRFRQMSDAEIAKYVATGEPMDKAGGYAIQGGAKSFVERVEGSISNVVGLPLEVLGPILVRLR